MSECAQTPPANTLLQPGLQERYWFDLAQVAELDPELLAYPETKFLIDSGLTFCAEVTDRFGTPSEPKWTSGSYEAGVLMTYHNGGYDGHTSVGPFGAGVPRNVLKIANLVNSVARHKVFDPEVRAAAFYAGAAHDFHQLCGRSLLPEGQEPGRGDERKSALVARDRYIQAGGDLETAQHIYNDVMATAFNPHTGRQHVNYDAWQRTPYDPDVSRAALGQELTAAADLLGTTQPRGALSVVEFTVESMCLHEHGQLIQNALETKGIDPAYISNMHSMLDFIGRDQGLRGAFAEKLQANSKFVGEQLVFTDSVIKAYCGYGIDELFPGRQANANLLANYAESIKAGAQPVEIWYQALHVAGYMK